MSLMIACATVLTMIKAYISNISPAWPVERQEAMIAAAAPTAPIFRDILDARDRRAHQPDRLVQRAMLLRPTRRRGGVFLAASPAVVDWTAEGLLTCVTEALARGASVRFLDTGLTIEATSGPAVLHQAVLAFAASRKRDAEVLRGKSGGKISGARRGADAKAKAETIRAEWRLPSEDHQTQALLDRAGISRNTAKKYLDKRSVAQRVYQASLKRRMKT